ncbi:hypothetical protein HC928_02260 [bacterium]|nr:hypothetical protein [bacterium]
MFDEVLLAKLARKVLQSFEDVNDYEGLQRLWENKDSFDYEEGLECTFINYSGDL